MISKSKENANTTQISFDSDDDDISFGSSDSDSDDYLPNDKQVKHLRIIGKAGVGKSTYIQNNFPPEDYIITAYTGIAASRLDVKTLSSLFMLGGNDNMPVLLSVKIICRQKRHRDFYGKKGLVIDEFYTLPMESMRKVDLILQEILHCRKPFGGLRLILVGDARQTEAVGRGFVQSPLYKKLKFDEIILPHHDRMRLKPIYMDFCDQFRNLDLTYKEIIHLLKDPRFSQKPVKNGMYLYHENKYVDKKNEIDMNEMKSEVIITLDGISYKRDCPICITNNSPDAFNGMLGILRDYNYKKNIVMIEFDNYILETPLKKIQFVPAFSITIHKAQSNTMQGANIFLSRKKIWDFPKDNIRLIYTALTRVSRFKKVYICLDENKFGLQESQSE